MPFNIYPDATTALLLGKPADAPLELVATEAMQRFVPLVNHVSDPLLGGAPTTFIRIAVSGSPLGPARKPRLELLAHDPDLPGGSPAPPLDPSTAVSLITAVPLSDDVNDTRAAEAFFSPEMLDNVYLLKVVIQIPGTRLWLRITNTIDEDPDTDDSTSFVWVVADSDADTRQPWIRAEFNHVAPAHVHFNVSVRQASAETARTIRVSNFGTGSVTIANVAPVIAPPYTLSGLPITLAPNASGRLNVGLDAPAAPGDISEQTFSVVASGSEEPGAGHADQIVLSAHISSNIWVTKRPMQTGRAALGLAAVDGKLYAVGGFTGREETNFHVVEEYTPSTDSWVSKARTPSLRMSSGLAARNGRLYAVGGADFFFNFTEPLDEYDPSTDVWTTRASIPTLRTELGVAFAGNGKLYAAGGFKFDADVDSTVTLKTVEEYDPATDGWSRKSQMLTARHGFGLAAGPNGRLYAVGGFGEQELLATVEEYDPATDNWRSRQPMPTARARFGFAAASNGKLYAVGGRGPEGSPITSVEEYDPITDVWSIKAPMRIARDDVALAATSDGKLYAIGGDGDDLVMSAVEECTL